MTSVKKVVNAVGGKTARACDSCIGKRARYYCAADDAFLCQACDSSVHSANPLARRHERVQLKTASCKSSSSDKELNINMAPSWLRGFTKKARTPRSGKNSGSAFHRTPKARDDEPARNPFHLVPEMGSDDTNSYEENEEQLLYRVPIFDPFVGELRTSTTPSSVAAIAGGGGEIENKGKDSSGHNSNHGVENLHGCPPSDIEIAEFAADVESLLGRGLENQCMGMEDLGLIDNNKEEEKLLEYSNSVGSGKVVKVETEESPEIVEGDEIQLENMGRETFELNFDYDSVETCEEVDVEEKVTLDRSKDTVKNNNGREIIKENNNEAKRKTLLLQLDYEAVITAWGASQKSPWITGDRPDFDIDQCWPQCMATCGMELHHPYGEWSGFGCHNPAMANGGREARVSRYREKRRTRLFSKKIRYEVRKLNAEKRPRMKGRFVKRASFAAPPFPLLNK